MSIRVTRRQFIRISSATATGAAAAALVPAHAAEPKRDAFPVLDVAEVAALKIDAPLRFTYPDASSPAVVLRLRQAAAGGIGPGNSVVAFSLLCTHKGCPVS